MGQPSTVYAGMIRGPGTIGLRAYQIESFMTNKSVNDNGFFSSDEFFRKSSVKGKKALLSCDACSSRDICGLMYKPQKTTLRVGCFA